MRSEDESKHFSEELVLDSISSTGTDSSDEEMEIIANFIENVDVTSQRNYSETYFPTAGGSPLMSLSSRSSFTDGGSCKSPLQMVQRRVNFHARLKQTREMVEDQGVFRKGPKVHSRERTIIQDMIDMSLGKKKVQTSEKMLRTAFVEFYRGLGLLKSYRYTHG